MSFTTREYVAVCFVASVLNMICY